MAKGYSARGGFSGGGSNMMRQQQQMQQKLMKMQQEMEKARPMWRTAPSPPLWAAAW